MENALQEIYKLKLQIKYLENRYSVMMDQVKMHCKGETARYGKYRVVVTQRPGLIEYKDIPLLRDINLELYRKPSVDVYKIEYLYDLIEFMDSIETALKIQQSESLVTGIFRDIKNHGGGIMVEFFCRKDKHSKTLKFSFEDGKTYSIPEWVVKHINKDYKFDTNCLVGVSDELSYKPK